MRSPWLAPRLALNLALALTLGACGEDNPRWADAPTASDARPGLDARPGPDLGLDLGPDPRLDAAPDATPGDAAPQDGAPDAGPPQRRARHLPDGPGFLDQPWPSDARLTPAGTPDLSQFPGERPSFLAVRAELEASVRGFATMPVIYIPFEDPIADAALPDPAGSLAPDAPVQLLALGAACGARIPLESAARAEADRFTPAHTLQLKNTVGTVLEPGQPYGLVVLRSFGAETGLPTTPAPAFLDAWRGDGSTLAANLAPLRACWAAQGLDPEQIAAATVFTPQDPVAELRALRDHAMDPALTPSQPPIHLRRDPAWSRRRLRITSFSGLVPMPVYQAGEPPYTQTGGALQFDAAGTPLRQRFEPVPFLLAWRELDDPPAPRPVLVFQDGTGWDRWTHLGGRFMGEILDQGFVIASFMPQFHGGRAGVEGEPELPTFNFLNPPAARGNFRQQAIENSYFSRVLREQLQAIEGLPPLDTARLVYGGHSQGALAGALTAAVESAYAAYVFNGLSAYLTLTILERKDIIDFELVVRGLLGANAPLDLFSPALHLMQLGSEAVDPHNFARLWRGTPHNPGGNHVFVTNGFTDDTTTPRGMDHLTLSAALPVFDPPGWDIDPFGVAPPPRVSPPVQGNTQALDGRPLTLATYLDGFQGHGTIYGLPPLREMAIGFWRDALAGAVPTLTATTELTCADGQDNDGDGLTDCADPDCAAREPCVELRCDDAADNDGDGLTDCDDPDCAGQRLCQEQICDDGLDNDDNGLTDCDDPACAARQPCAETACRDRQDNDGDGLTDCEDPDCAGTRDCREWSCSDGVDNDRDGLTDCADPECAASLACPAAACPPAPDPDPDQPDPAPPPDPATRAACQADPRCFGFGACRWPAETACADGQDNDGDGLTDCDDPDCALACPHESCADGDLGQATGVALYQGDLTAQPDRFDPGDCTALGAGEAAPDLALRWTAPAAGTYLISTLRSAPDTVLTLYRDGCEGFEFACHDDQPGVTSAAIRLEIGAGDTVILVISAYSATDLGPVTLHILPEG